ncbi:MAG TPA: hypothetical protein VN934_08525 [Candidatus Tumulicola sp.]|nr:hypothetical protein [Candidatus Tumulicola sp.]
MHRLKAGLVGLLCLVGVAGCTTNNSIAPTIFSTNATLQLSVGTVADYGNPAILASRINHLSTAGPLAFVNAVSTFRNQFGNSAYLVPGTATLTLPSTAVSTVGSLFEYGQAAGNNGIYGVAPAFNPIGGCPAAPNSCVPTGYIYQSSPRATFGAIPIAGGTYTLATSVSVNGGTIPYSASATLPALAGILANPCTGLAFVSDGLGGGTFTLTPAAPPAGVTERVVIVTVGTSNQTTVRAVVLASGSTGVVPDVSSSWGANTIAAGTNHAFCMGADFPWIEDGQPNNTAAAPTLTNGINGTSNFSVSAYFTIVE